MSAELETYDFSHTCPLCRTVLDGASSLTGGKPAPGAVSVCSECGEIFEFGQGMTTRRLTPEELFELMLDPNWKMIEAAQAIARVRGQTR